MNREENKRLNRETKPHSIVTPPHWENSHGGNDEYIPVQIPNVPRSCRPPSLGWMEMRLDGSDMDCLWKYIETAKKENVTINNSANKRLAGNISSSLTLVDSDNFFRKVLDPLCAQYQLMFGDTPNIKATPSMHPLELVDMWVNFQKKHEFNPAHTHTGIFSFVIFMKIPTNYRDQKKLSIANLSNSDAISNFAFSYVDIFGNITHHPMIMSPEYEGIILLFPSSLPHQVYPFYESDETRITISGNLGLNTKLIFDENSGLIKETSLLSEVNKKIDPTPSPQKRNLFSGL